MSFLSGKQARFTQLAILTLCLFTGTACSQTNNEQILLLFIPIEFCILPQYTNKFAYPYVDEALIEPKLRNSMNAFLREIKYEKNSENEIGLIFFDKKK